jgi:hypothetical protein
MRFDSLADYFLLASGLDWLWILEPSVFRAHPVMWITIALAVAVPQTICSIRTGRNAGFHLYSSKAAGWVAVIAFLHAILSGRHSDFLLYVFAVAVILNCSEESLVSLLVRDPYQNVRAYMQRGISKADRVLTPIASLRFLEATPG